MTAKELATRMNSMSAEEIARAMEKMPTEALEFGVKFEAMGMTPDQEKRFSNIMSGGSPKTISIARKLPTHVWISIDARKPEKDQIALVWFHDDACGWRVARYRGEWSGQTWWATIPGGWDVKQRVTHWMELEAPR